MTFNEYLNTATDNSEVIFDYYLIFLNEFSSKDFPYEEQLKLNGVAGKFLNCVEKVSYAPKEERDKYLDRINQFKEELRQYRRTKNRSKFSKVLIPNPRIGLHRIQDTFEDLYSKTLGYINEASRIDGFSDNLTLNGFYQPANSNKRKIQELINEAIILISEDETLTEKSKKQIIDYLNKVLRELDRENVNWSKIIGRIKETIIVLGALGSFAGGVTPLLTQAKDKLEETTIVIQQTSINLNYNVLNETFNVQNIQQIRTLNSTILQIEENNKK